MVLFRGGLFANEIMLGIDVLLFVVKVQFVKFSVFLNHFGSLHVQRNWQMSHERKVRVLNIFSVHFFILIQEIRILEFLNWLMSNFRDPVVDPKPPVLYDHLLKIFELVTLIVISFKILYKLFHMVPSVHNLCRLVEIKS